MYNKKHNMVEIFEQMTNGGLRFTRYKNSKFTVIEKNSVYRPGKVFGTTSKENLVESNGLIMGSVETIIDNHKELTHITPNVYRSGKKFEFEGRKGTKGHSEANLKQINAFVIDIDGIDKTKYDQVDIAIRGLDAGIEPTLILDTPKGYQVMYFIQDPIYINKNSPQAVNMAKRISTNLRHYYAEIFPGVDLACNHFGYFRCPKQENILSYSKNFIHPLEKYLDFSREYEKINFEERKVDTKKIINFKALKSIHEPWFHMLINCTHIKGDKGNIGRDNAIYTMSLHLYSCNIDKAEAMKMMKKFNKNLQEPLEEKIVEQKVNSAYKGVFKGANRFYIERLLYVWCEITDKDRNRIYLRNHAKKREDRVRSHFTEWEGDIYAYVNERAKNGGLVTTKAQIIKDLGIAKSSLNEVLKETKTLIWSATIGRNAKLKITTLKAVYAFLQTCIVDTKKLKSQYRAYLSMMMPEMPLNRRETIVEKLIAIDNNIAKNLDISSFSADSS